MSRWLPYVAWAALLASLVAAIHSGLVWREARRINAQIADKTLIELKAIPDKAGAHYAAGWLHERAGHTDLALENYASAESASDPQGSARARFGMGNLYFQNGLRAGDVAAGGSHVRGLAQLELAREAYRSALRVDPELRAARYNLELLERLSPARRTQGWSREEENLRLRQGEEHGWAAMKEGNLVRGLP
ncbi:MAG: hypothetical protein ACT4PZ_19690 [Panacagrimonas sp.]